MANTGQINARKIKANEQKRKKKEIHSILSWNVYVCEMMRNAINNYTTSLLTSCVGIVRDGRKEYIYFVISMKKNKEYDIVCCE